MAGILIAGDDPHLKSPLDSLPCQRGNDVIRLPSSHFDQRKVKRLNDLFEERQLRTEIFGHLGAVGFIGGIDRIAGAGTRRIHRADQPGRFVDSQQTDQIATESEHGIRRHSRRTGHRGYGVKHLKHQ